MSTPIHAILTGTFTSNGAVRNISLPSGYDKFELVNITDIGSAAAATPVMKATGCSSFAAGSAYYSTKTNGAATLDLEVTTLTGGFTFVSDSSSTSLGAAVAVTAITNANPAVVSSASTAAVGDIVRVYATTGMLQIAGLDFTVTATNPGVTQSLGYMNAGGFLAPATAGFIEIIPFDSRFYPKSRYITAITQAASAVITLSVTHGYTVGQLVRIIVPSEFGMTQMNNRLVTITAINTATNTITVNVDSTAFTAFAYPTSAIAAAGVTFPQVVPVGETASATYANLLDDATRNISFTGVQIGTTVQTTAKVYQWFAYKGVSL